MQTQKGLVFRSFFFIALIFLFHPIPSHGLNASGIISSDTHWTTADSPIVITGDILVAQNSALTIDPGVGVIFQSRSDTARGYTLTIEGEMIAKGDPMHPIVFTAQDRTKPWGTIIFNDMSTDWNEAAATGSIMEYCVIEYGGNNPESAAMISCLNAMPLITHNVIRFSSTTGLLATASTDQGGINSLSGSIQIISNLIYKNSTGVQLSAEGGRLFDNYFLYNTRAVDLLVRSNDIQIKNNTIISSAPEIFGTGIQVQLDDPTSGIKSYLWEQTGGTPVVLQNPQSAKPTFNAPDPGGNVASLVFRLAVTDENGRQASETVRLTVIGSNAPPVARAGADQNVRIPQTVAQQVTVNLNGAASADSQGIAGYQWTQTSGMTVDLQDSNSANARFLVSQSVVAGDRMTFQLTVTDQGGLSSADTVDIIFYQNNVYPVAAAGSDQTVVQGQTVNLNGSGSSGQDDGISSYTWTQTEGPIVTIENPNTAIASFIAPQVGATAAETLTFRLTIVDKGGLPATDTISIKVKGSLIADPGADRTVSASEDVTLDGTRSVNHEARADVDLEANVFTIDYDPNQNTEGLKAGVMALSATDNASFQLDINSNNIIDTFNANYLVYMIAWPAVSTTIAMPGNYWGTNDSMTINNSIFDHKNNYNLPSVEFQPFTEQPIPDIGSTQTYPSIADAGADIQTSADQPVTLDGSQSYNPDGKAQYEWKQIQGPTVALKNTDQAKASFVAPLGGEKGTTLQFQLTVSTGSGFSHSDTTSVTVAPDAPIQVIDVGGCFLHTMAPSGKTGSGLNSIPVNTALALIFLLFVSISRRWISFVVWAMTLTISFCSPAFAGYFVVGGGAGGDADTYNVTMETGAKEINAGNLNLLFGVGIPFIPHGDKELPDQTISTPCPNNDFVRLENKRKGTEVGLLGKLGLELGSTSLYLTAIGGCTVYTESELARSQATGLHYEQSSKSKIGILFGGGISYFPDYLKWPIVIQADYDNVRGATGTIGWYW